MPTKRSVFPPLEISKVIFNANVFNLRNWNKSLMSGTNLPQTVTQLFTMLRDRKIDHVLDGGLALLQYVEGRNTEDIDLILAAESLKKLPEIQITDQTSDFARGTFDELRIDIRLTNNGLFQKIQQHYEIPQHFAESTIPCASVEGLLLLKMYTLPSLYRQGDFTRVGLYENDIRTLLYIYQTPMQPLLDEIAPHLDAADLREVQTILAEIQHRIDLFRARHQTPPDPSAPKSGDLGQ